MQNAAWLQNHPMALQATQAEVIQLLDSVTTMCRLHRLLNSLTMPDNEEDMHDGAVHHRIWQQAKNTEQQQLRRLRSAPDKR